VVLLPQEDETFYRLLTTLYEVAHVPAIEDAIDQLVKTSYAGSHCKFLPFLCAMDAFVALVAALP
jgi:hypothetical protein